jgi:hypothetical protein
MRKRTMWWVDVFSVVGAFACVIAVLLWPR